jgi:hypothetical protein
VSNLPINSNEDVIACSTYLCNLFRWVDEYSIYAITYREDREYEHAIAY